MMFFDNNATTPLHPDVLEAMLQDLDGMPRNPSSVTRWGREGRVMLSTARRELAEIFDVSDEEVLFTSGGTEGLHMAIRGLFAKEPGHVITTKIEHTALLCAVDSLNTDVTYVEVSPAGAPTIDAIVAATKQNTTMIALSGVNNETGVINRLEEIAQFALDRKIALVIDGVAMLGKVPITFYDGITAMIFSGHKCHGPKGSGFVLLRKKAPFSPLLTGGHQENKKRGGTENLPAILGLVQAVKLINGQSFDYLAHLRDTFELGVKNTLDAVEINGTGPRVSNTANLYFPSIEAESLLIHLDQEGVIASLGSACSSGSLEPSHVLLGMGLSKERALSSLRFSFGRMNTMAEVESALQILSVFHTNRLLVH